MRSKLNKKNGFTLVSAILISTLVILIGSVFVYKFSIASKDVVRDKNIRLVKNIAEEGLGSYVQFVYKINSPSGLKTQAERDALAALTGDKFLIGAAYDPTNPLYPKATAALRDLGVLVATPAPTPTP